LNGFLEYLRAFSNSSLAMTASFSSSVTTARVYVSWTLFRLRISMASGLSSVMCMTLNPGILSPTKPTKLLRLCSPSVMTSSPASSSPLMVSLVDFSSWASKAESDSPPSSAPSSRR